MWGESKEVICLKTIFNVNEGNCQSDYTNIQFSQLEMSIVCNLSLFSLRYTVLSPSPYSSLITHKEVCLNITLQLRKLNIIDCRKKRNCCITVLRLLNKLCGEKIPNKTPPPLSQYYQCFFFRLIKHTVLLHVFLTILNYV